MEEKLLVRKEVLDTLLEIANDSRAFYGEYQEYMQQLDNMNDDILPASLKVATSLSKLMKLTLIMVDYEEVP